jgi:hypothetical protein
MRSPETTARIERDHLRELLDLERTTARMPAMTLTGLLTVRDEDLAPDPRPLVVKFHTPGPLHVLEAMPRSLVIAVSFSATLLVISLLLRLL